MNKLVARRKVLPLLPLLTVSILWVGAESPQSPAQSGDPIELICDEGLNRSQLMETLIHLTDVIGPRLSGSPAMRRANDWTRAKLAEWGLENAHLESWGTFLPGWMLERFFAQVLEPRCVPLIAFPKAWSPGPPAMLEAEAVYFDATDKAGLERHRGALRGKIVLNGPVREIGLHFEPDAKRKTDKDLLELANAPAVARPRPARQAPPRPEPPPLTPADKAQFFLEEGAALVLDPGSEGDGGTLFVEAPSLPTSLRAKSGFPSERDMIAHIVPQVVVAVEQYNSMVRMIQHGERIKLAIELSVRFEPVPENYSTIAEIRGTDLADEIVIVGAHLDSLHSATGAMEAVRILKALGLSPRRTIRIALWGGEEVGMRGSRAYVEEHFGKMEGKKLLPKTDYEKLSACFNLDNGAGKIRGVYLHGIEAAYPIFREWLAPFQGSGADTITVSQSGGSDHMSFNAVGLPGISFIQDELERSRTHHSNQDLLDRVQPEELKHNAVVLATLVYRTAMRDERMPRRRLPSP